MLQGAQIAHLESLLGAAAQPITAAPEYSAITPVLGAGLLSSQVGMPDCTTAAGSDFSTARLTAHSGGGRALD